jgi:hypothetical protein
MENKRIVRFFLSTILEQQVTEVDVLPQEFSYRGETETNTGNVAYSMFRIDFMATVLAEDGTRKKILIEVQKSWDRDDVMRFRKYLGEQYGRKDGGAALPIITIYILGFRLAGIGSPCIKVRRIYTDMMNGEPVEAKSEFVEKLTHDSYVIQTGRITDSRYSTNLDKLLSIFEQACFVRHDSETVKEYCYQPDDENMELITDVLHEMVANPEERKQIENEEEALRILDELFGSKIRERESMIEEQKKAIEEQAKAIEEQAKAIEKKDREIEELKKLLTEKRQ